MHQAASSITLTEPGKEGDDAIGSASSDSALTSLDDVYMNSTRSSLRRHSEESERERSTQTSITNIP